MSKSRPVSPAQQCLFGFVVRPGPSLDVYKRRRHPQTAARRNAARGLNCRQNNRETWRESLAEARLALCGPAARPAGGANDRARGTAGRRIPRASRAQGDRRHLLGPPPARNAQEQSRLQGTDPRALQVGCAAQGDGGDRQARHRLERRFPAGRQNAGQRETARRAEAAGCIRHAFCAAGRPGKPGGGRTQARPAGSGAGARLRQKPPHLFHLLRSGGKRLLDQHQSRLCDAG